MDDNKQFDDGYDENLLGDEEDKKKLAQMTEKEREQELFNRSERRETLKIRFEIERKLRSKAQKREQEKKEIRARKRLRASEIYSSDESDESDEYTPDKTAQSALLITSSSSSNVSSASSSSSSSESELEDTKEPEEDGQTVQPQTQLSLEELRSIQLKRDTIEKWVYSPFFKETAIGLFVKISVGLVSASSQEAVPVPMYKIAQIIDITKGNRIYTLNNGKYINKTDKQCLVRIKGVDRTYAMSFVSNKSFSEDDYRSWKDGQDMPSREFYNKKRRDLHRAANYEYKDEDIHFEVAERSRFKDHPFNFALKKTELNGEKADAEASNDYEKARQIQSMIDELEEKARELEKTRSSSTFSAISFVNERNRYKNIVESERVLKESKNVKTEDPFTRRKCNPTIVHNKNNGQLPNVQPATNNNNITTINNQKSTKPEVDDLFEAHASIDLEIDI